MINYERFNDSFIMYNTKIAVISIVLLYFEDIIPTFGPYQTRIVNKYLYASYFYFISIHIQITCVSYWSLPLSYAFIGIMLLSFHYQLILSISLLLLVSWRSFIIQYLFPWKSRPVSCVQISMLDCLSTYISSRSLCK